jgi:hypothetical protein
MEKINLGDFTEDDIRNAINDLKYQSYRYNRQRSPEIAHGRWHLIYGVDAYLYEVIYQKEIGNDPHQ